MKHKDYKLAAVVFTDIVGFSRMMESNENATLAFLEYHNDLIQNLAQEHRGKVIKTIGDAFLLEFPTALDAVRCSIEIQNSIGQYNQTSGQATVQLRIGVHLGDIYFYENDALGEGINIASRLQSASLPGTITISREIYSQVSGKIPLKVESMGQVQLKNISREVHAYRILSGEPLPATATESDVIETQKPSVKKSSRFQELIGQYKVWRKLDQAPGFNQNSSSSDTWFSEYLEKLEARQVKAESEWWGSLFSFLGVNAGLFYINQATGSSFPWAAVTAISWGIGILGQIATLFTGRKNLKEAKMSGQLSEKDGRELKQFHEQRTGFWTHLFTSAGVISLLLFLQGTIDGFTHFPWSLVASGAMTLGFFGRLAAWLGQRSRHRLKKPFMKNVTPVQKTVNEDIPKEVMELEASIRRSLSVINPKTLPWAQDMEPLLDQYLLQIGKLNKAEKEMSRVLHDLSSDDLDQREEKINQRLEKARSESLKLEYGRALGLLKKQKISRDDLEDQRELISLKVDGAVQTLKQIQIDLTRILSTGTGGDSESLTLLKKRSDELGHDLLDYTSSWHELESGI